ncbi:MULTISPECIES: glycosyltransferase [unclassified Novosphingobium]|uniref:glycosyltransferase n=1 Tax=unclassified Novosphingobium TaxID=2644732 RepID=UPI00086D7686|nr:MULTISPECIES: glycosyltransferase [unclassified Novosphingobium]MBN9142836.1 glycosyltransferase [Novosphingobium sp.]MDR6705921.1 glycosyltransferase involved in cell wall biosynthesis [Novosphingobium sp. 1748]ODU85005.1 MAG: hypothetical protein ABT10_01795 [Novosphingobium sp. SCN 63-17]OJX89215.1 MAG: hypothetical protein BGP00_13280 [Novosphingobium sp. 63-713]
MTRILHIITTCDLRGGGPIEAARNMGTIWAGQGHSHDLLTLDPEDADLELPGYPGRIFKVGVPVGKSLAARYRYSPAMVPWLKANAHNYDAVIVSGLWRYQTMGAANALIDLGIPYFVFTHGMLDPWFRKRYPLKHAVKQVSWLLAEGRLLRNAANVMFTCEEEGILAQDAFWPYSVNAACVGYGTRDVAGDPAAQKAAFRAAVPELADKRFLLFLSRIHEKKGCDLLLDGFARVAGREPDLDLVIAGPDQTGLVATLKAQAEKLGIGHRVHFPGMLKGDIKYGAFRAAEAFVLTSHQENFGIVVAEALACNTPVLISDKVNIWREVESDGAGLVGPDTAEGAYKVLSGYLDLSQDERLAMREKARECFINRFRIEEVATRLMALIESHLNKVELNSARH